MAGDIRDVNRIPQTIAGLRTGTSQGVKNVGQKTISRIEDGFDAGQDALGRSWEPLDPETIRQKGHSDILVEDGDLQESFDLYEGHGRNTVIIGSDSDVLQYHEFGVPENNLPRRPVMRPAAIWAEEELLEDEVADTVKRHLTAFL